MSLIVLVIFSQHFNTFSQYLVMYLVPVVKGLPGVDLVCHARLYHPGIVMEGRVLLFFSQAAVLVVEKL